MNRDSEFPETPNSELRDKEWECRVPGARFQEESSEFRVEKRFRVPRNTKLETRNFVMRGVND